jgi:high-affinity iron transporter
LTVGGAFIALCHKIKDTYSKDADLVEGIFNIIAAMIILFVGKSLLDASKMEENMTADLMKSWGSNPKKKHYWMKRWWNRLTSKYVRICFPFIIVVREGLEAAAFIAGVAVSGQLLSVPISLLSGLIAGALIGLVFYK